MRRRIFLSVMLAFSACSSNEQEPLDVRVPLPEAQANIIDLVSEEAVIPPHTEVMYCYYMQYQGENVALVEMESLQGIYGHHSVPFTYAEEDDNTPVGTMADCTDMGEVLHARPLILPTERLSAGHGLLLKNNQRIIFQFHYVNAGRDPLLVRDVIRLHTAPMSEIEQFVSLFVTNSFDVNIPVQAAAEATIDCLVPEDLTILMVLGHMHEFGTRFDMLHGDESGGPMETIYSVDPWIPHYRDVPPVKLFFSAPLVLPAGSILRTHCEWFNDSDAPLGFPQEMCSGSGYVLGDAPIACSTDGGFLE